MSIDVDDVVFKVKSKVDNASWCNPTIVPIVRGVKCPQCQARAGNPCWNQLYGMDGKLEGERKRKQRRFYQNYVHAARRKLYVHQKKHGDLPLPPPERNVKRIIREELERGLTYAAKHFTPDDESIQLALPVDAIRRLLPLVKRMRRESYAPRQPKERRSPSGS